MYALLLCLAFAADHEGLSGSILQDPNTGEVGFAVGRTGQFTVNSIKQRVSVRVLSVLGAKEMVVGPEVGFAFSLIVKGVPTAGLADDKVIRLPGTWKITGTRKHGGRTLYVAEKYAPPPPPVKTVAERKAEAEHRRKQEETNRAWRERVRLAKEEAEAKARAVKTEPEAQTWLAVAVRIHKRGESDKAARRFRDIVKDYPGTKAAAEAARLLREIEGK